MRAHAVPKAIGVQLFASEVNCPGHQRVRQLSLEEEAALAREIPDPVDWAKVVVAPHTGLRRGEQFRLRWSEHVDFTTGLSPSPTRSRGNRATSP